MAPKSPTCVKFSSFEFRFRDRFLSFNREPVKLTPRASDVLAVLLENRGEIISKEQLLDLVWKDIFVEDGNVTNKISEIKKALRGFAEGVFIRNVPRQGYQFVADVEPCQGEEFADDGFVSGLGYFEDFQPLFSKVIPNAQKMTLYFIHSRRWREQHREAIGKFLRKGSAELNVILPNPSNEALFHCLQNDFIDGPSIPQLVSDALQDFATFYFEFPGKVKVRLFDHYPTYSFYRIDGMAIVAMYHTVLSRGPVPTMRVNDISPYWNFFQEDISILLRTRPLSKSAMRSYRDMTYTN